MYHTINKLLASHGREIHGAIVWLLLFAAPLPIDESLVPIVRLLLLVVGLQRTAAPDKRE